MCWLTVLWNLFGWLRRGVVSVRTGCATGLSLRSKGGDMDHSSEILSTDGETGRKVLYRQARWRKKTLSCVKSQLIDTQTLYELMTLCLSGIHLPWTTLSQATSLTTEVVSAWPPGRSTDLTAAVCSASYRPLVVLDQPVKSGEWTQCRSSWNNLS